MGQNSLLFVWKKIFGNFNYFFLTIFIAFAFYFFSTVTNNISNMGTFFENYGFVGTVKILFLYSLEAPKILPVYSSSSLIVLSILSGILITLLIYRFRLSRFEDKKNLGIFASIGVFLGLFVPGCAACGIGLGAVFGLGAALTALPYQGAEIAIIAIVIVAISIIKVSNSFINCKIQ